MWATLIVLSNRVLNRRWIIVSTLLFVGVAGFAGARGQEAAPPSAPSGKPTISKILVASDSEGLSIEISTNSPVIPDTQRLEHPDRLVFDFRGFSLQGPAQHIAVNKGAVLAVRASLFQANPPLSRIVIDLKEPTNVHLQAVGNKILIKVPFDNASPASIEQRPAKDTSPAPPSAIPQAASALPSNPQSRPDERAGQEPASEYDVLAKARAVTLEELAELEAKAQGGDPKAETMLALAYHAGVLLKNDEEEALRLLRLAADQGYVAAEESLGIYYAAGVGMEKPDPQAALKWYTAAAQKGSVDAAANIGSMYAGGDGVPRDMSTAIRWFRQAADAGGASAAYNLALIYRRGDGVARDEQQAMSWLRKAADHDFIPALRETGYRAAYPRDGSTADIPMALQRYKRAAELGDPISQAILGDIFSNGELTKPDYDQAAKYYRMAADQGQRDGEFGLAVRYTLGQGAPVDQGEAMRLFKAAADQGHADAQYDLGVMYELGQATEPDPPSAAHYYQLAAEQGVVKAQYRIGVLLAKGSGVEADRVSAYKWLLLAQDSITSATKALNELRPSMSPSEISEAEHQVDAWRIARKQSHN
jgi:TPR repeat protein